MGVTLITAIQSRSLRVYPDADLRQQALNVVAVEKPDGMMRMDKARSGRKIDAVVAMAIALRMATVVPPSWAPFAWSVNRSTSGALSSDPANPGLSPREREMLHPHERGELETNESDLRLGREKAERRRQAWQQGQVAADAGAKSREDEARGAPAHCRCNLPVSDLEGIYYGCRWNAVSGAEYNRRNEAKDFAEALKRGWKP